MDEAHTCSEYDQLNTCVECGAPKNRTNWEKRTGGAGSRTQPLTDDEYSRQLEKLTSR